MNTEASISKGFLRAGRCNENVLEKLSVNCSTNTRVAVSISREALEGSVCVCVCARMRACKCLGKLGSV